MSRRVQGAPEIPVQVAPRAKTLGAGSLPTVRPSIVGTACEIAGVSKRGLALALDVDPHIVRDIAAGIRPLTEERLRAMPRAVQRAFHELSLSALDDDSPMSGMSPERHLLRIGHAFGELCQELHASLADAQFTRDEKLAVLRKIRAEIGVLHALEVELQREIAAEDAQ